MALNIARGYIGKRFVGKVAVCTASTSGLGLAAAERLAQEGAKVVISSRKSDNVERAVELLRSKKYDVSGVVCHQASAKDRQKLIHFAVEKYGGIDHLFVNAAVNPHYSDSMSITEETWDKIFDVNVSSTFEIIKDCVPYMKQRGSGSIVITASLAGIYPEYQCQRIMTYAISKTAIIALTTALAIPLSEHKIRINCLAPAGFKTNFLKGIMESKEDIDYLVNVTAMKRIAEPEEYGSTVVFFLSDDASFISGVTIPLHGGLNHMGLNI